MSEILEAVELPPALRRFAGTFVEAITSGDTGADAHAGLYLVGSPALGDISPRQSNLDLVAVTGRPLAPTVLDRLSREHRHLGLNGRPPVICYTTWDGLSQPPEDAPATVFEGRTATRADRFANPMTWSILASHPFPITGPDRPYTPVHSSAEEVRAWFRHQLPLVVDRTSRLLWRRHLTRVVLQSVRCAHGAITGEVVSLRRAGEAALEGSSHTSHQVITDALGYRDGANTSMYWGPFERKTNAGTLGVELLKKAAA